MARIEIQTRADHQSTPTLEDAIDRAANYAKAEEELASLVKQHIVEKKPHSNTSVRHENRENNPRKVSPKDAGPQARKQHAHPGFAFNIGDESKEGEPQTKRWTRDRNAYCEFHQSNGRATVNCETMHKVLAEKYAKRE